MAWIFLLFTALAFAQAPETPVTEDPKDVPKEPVDPRNHVPPIRKIDVVAIRNSGTQLGAMRPGVTLVEVRTNRSFKLSRAMFVRFHELQDEAGFKYLVNKDGTCTYKTAEHYVEPIKDQLALYEPPLRYTPAPVITRRVYDKSITLLPEASFYAGYVVSSFMEDLYNDKEAGRGISNQVGAHVFTAWDLPVRVGAVLHYEKAAYDLSGGGSVTYSAFSFGPQIKSRDTDFVADFPLRMQANFRVSPFARATATSDTGSRTYRFNSADLMASVEHPVRNGWGELVIGLFGQLQWLNLKDAPDVVSIRASNNTNKSLGLSVSQVFR